MKGDLLASEILHMEELKYSAYVQKVVYEKCLPNIHILVVICYYANIKKGRSIYAMHHIGGI